MTTTIENLFKTIASSDETITREDIDTALNILLNRQTEEKPLVSVMKTWEVASLLGIHKNTVHKYIAKGLFAKVYGANKFLLGISRESYIRFTEKRTTYRTASNDELCSALKVRSDKEGKMKTETEAALRNLLVMDEEILPEDIEKAIAFLKREDKSNKVVHMIKFKDVLDLLHCDRRTLEYYIQNGYLTRVYGGGKRAIGVSRESYVRFMTLHYSNRNG